MLFENQIIFNRSYDGGLLLTKEYAVKTGMMALYMPRVIVMSCVDAYHVI